MSFANDFRVWLENSLKDGVPSSVKAFAFNLFEYRETSNVKFGVELVGTEAFDTANSDWACDEVWEPEQRALEIPINYSGGNWEECLERVKTLIAGELGAGKVSEILKSRLGVGVGFVDGDMEVVWQF